MQFWRQKYTVTSLTEPRVNILKTEVFPIEEQEPVQLRALQGREGFREVDDIHSLKTISLLCSAPQLLCLYFTMLNLLVIPVDRKYKEISVFQFLYLSTSCAMLMSVQWDWRLLWVVFGLSLGFAILDHTDAAVGPLTCGRNHSALRQVLLGARGQQNETISEHRIKGNCNKNVSVWI